MRPFLLSRRTKNIAYLDQDQHRPSKHFDPINDRIHYPEVLVIGPQGEQLGVMSSRAANELALRYNLDLFCVAPDGHPPVCKILNYGKYRFEQQKNERIARKNQHVAEIKTIQITPMIGAHDMETKVRSARSFFADGSKVIVVVFFKGRQMAHKEAADVVFQKFFELVSDVATIEVSPSWEGRRFSGNLAPKAKK